MSEYLEEQGLLFYTIEEYQEGRRASYWAGVISGAAGVATIVFVSLWILGGYVQ